MANEAQSPLWMQANPTGGGEPAPDGMADALADAIGDRLGRRVDFVDTPTTADTTFGPGTVAFSLRADDTLPTEWMGRLVVFPTGAESTVLGAAALLPCGVADLVTDDLALPDELGGAAAVAEVPAGRGLVEVIGAEPDTATPRLRALATVQAQLHAVDVRKIEGIPALDFEGVLATLPDDLATEAAWLRSNCPPPGSEVLCHGGLSPLIVRVDADDPDQLVVRRWSAAVRAEHTYDLAWTLLGFWLAPFLAATRNERRDRLVIRDDIARLYRSTYQATSPVTEERLVYWQAFHAAVAAGHALRHPGDAPEGVVPALRKRFSKLAR